MSADPEKKEKIAVVLFNMGGPDSLKAVKPFLFNLFYDPAIIALKNPLRWIVAKIISGKRGPIAREIYQKIGGKSPILDQTKDQAKALEQKLNNEGDIEYRCFIAMRYWHPFARETVKQVQAYKPDRIVLLPLYPHYSITTVGSSLINWDKNARAAGLDIPYKAIRDYPEAEDYLKAHIDLIEEARGKLTDPDRFRILYSAHGLPEKIIEAGDPYRDQVEQTCRALQEKLGHPDHVICYQSRSGPLKWIEPYTEDEIKRAGADQKSVIIVPIAFVSEHSETLVELDMEYRELATDSGVKDYIRVAAIGCHDSFISALGKLTKEAFR
ncbi:Ferrochelatase, protoheme ferro-lyase [hydrothermal vent metagenome]|uniref:Ferrochelatase, protoheme ferro-lyase n=1 Tax=hydrothermal vent metagenome TaxID=652676 RepID=A0A3B0RLW3_9ZZZZ